jgi:hypothetical protein
MLIVQDAGMGVGDGVTLFVGVGHVLVRVNVLLQAEGETQAPLEASTQTLA